MELIILAGGLGTRLRSVVPDRPKPMALVGAKPFLAHLMEYWVRLGVTHFILGVGYRYEVIQSYFGKSFHQVPISYAIEPEPLGTGGGLCYAASYLQGNGPFLVANGDSFVNINLSTMRQKQIQANADIVIASVQIDSCNRYAVLQIAKDDRIQGFGIKSQETQGESLINAGVYWFQNKILLEALGKKNPTAFSLEEIAFPSWLSQGHRLYSCLMPGAFIDIGVPKDYHRCRGFFAESLSI